MSVTRIGATTGVRSKDESMAWIAARGSIDI
jgi:hypothetical protein